MTISAILFDKDGTLLNFASTFEPATARVIDNLSAGDSQLAMALAQAVDFDLQTQKIRAGSVLIAGSVEEIAQCWKPHVASEKQTEITLLVDRLFVEATSLSLVGFPFLVSTLEALTQKQLPLGVATNDTETAAHSHLGSLNVEGFFTFVAGSDSGFGAKPGPGMVLGFAEHCGVEANRVAMVGDSPHDCMAAKAAGALAVGVASGAMTAQELSNFADVVLNDISELPQFIEMLGD